MVVDLRGLNEITESDNYLMPLQSDIISAVSNYFYISTVNDNEYFHQFLVRKNDRAKFIIISHREQEVLNVTLMRYKDFSSYVQRQTDALLRSYHSFARVYIDDIIIFSHTLEDHVDHLDQIFSLFRKRRVCLSLKKSFLSYSFIMLLGQRVDSLRMSTSEEKVKVITSLSFLKTLRDLETFLDLTR